MSNREEFDKDEERILDLLARARGLSREFPNPQRVGCPDSTIVKGLAFRKLRLADVEQWMDHLGTCSSCYRDFTAFRKEAWSQQRRHKVSEYPNAPIYHYGLEEGQLQRQAGG